MGGSLSFVGKENIFTSVVSNTSSSGEQYRIRQDRKFSWLKILMMSKNNVHVVAKSFTN